MSDAPPFIDAEAVLACEPVVSEAGQAIGPSREGRAIRAFAFGEGPLCVSLIGGCHADEPVGPWMLRRLANYLNALAKDDPLLSILTWSIVPHVNPDGEARNLAWCEPGGEPPALDAGFDALAYLAGARRELPGDDIEFGFPRGGHDAGARPENRAVAEWLRGRGPFALHVSFHGMAYAGGPWFLLDKAWAARSRPLQKALAEKVDAMGYALHDVERHGEKGFVRIARGFCTRPDSKAMAQYFLDRNDPVTAAKFRPSSMEFVRALGGDALTLVSEMPLFVLEGQGDAIDPDPVAERFKHETLPAALAALAEDKAAQARQALAQARLKAMPIGDQMRLQLAFLQAGLDLVRATG